jgi:hypothetical protein
MHGRNQKWLKSVIRGKVTEQASGLKHFVCKYGNIEVKQLLYSRVETHGCY